MLRKSSPNYARMPFRSTHTSFDSSRLLSYITSVRIGDSLWNRTSHSFVLHWQEQVWLYESLVDMASHFSPEQKMHMLQNAIHPHEELRQVKNQADQLQVFHGKGIGYDSYCNLLLSAASNVDAKHAPKGRASAVKRNMYIHDLGNFEDNEFHDTYNLDSDIVDLQANVYKQQPKDLRFAQSRTLQNLHAPMFPTKSTFLKLHLSSQQWHSLQPEACVTWDQLSNEAKAIMLSLHKDPGKYAINLHNVSAFDFLQANLHEHLLDKIEDPVKIPPDPDKDHGNAGAQFDKDTSTVLLAFLSKQKSTAHPGHLANILSTTKSKNAKGARFMTKSDMSSPKDGKIVITGRHIARSKLITSIILSPPTSHGEWVHWSAEVPMVALLVMMFVSLRNLIKLSMSEVLTTIKSPTSPL